MRRKDATEILDRTHLRSALEERSAGFLDVANHQVPTAQALRWDALSLCAPDPRLPRR